MKRLWVCKIDFGRMGELGGVWIATTKEMEALRDKSIYLDDVLGKHSGIDIEFDDYFFDDCLKEINLPEDVLEQIENATGKFVGGNFYPFDYNDQIEEQESGE